MTHVHFYPSAQQRNLNNEKNCGEISEDKIAVYEKTAGLRYGSSSDLSGAAPVAETVSCPF